MTTTPGTTTITDDHFTAGHEVLMLTVSLVLIAAALALSTVAVTIAAYYDLRDRDQGVHPQRKTRVDAPHAARPTLRIWQPPSTPSLHNATAAAAKSAPSAGPDIIVGPGAVASTTDDGRPPAAA